MPCVRNGVAGRFSLLGAVACLSAGCSSGHSFDVVPSSGGTASSGASESGGDDSSGASGPSSGGGASSGSPNVSGDNSTASSAAGSSAPGAVAAFDAATEDGASSGAAASQDAGEAHRDGGPPNPNAAPGVNFDLSLWELQEPIGSPGSPTTILAAQLASGFHDTYFYTDPSDGSMTFWDPENGVTTPNSNFPRSELREMTASGAAANWPAKGTNTLSATLKVTEVPDHVCVGQIHLGTGTPSSTKPLLELFYSTSGAIALAIEQSPAGENEMQHPVGDVPLGTKWSYVIGLSGNTISLIVNGGAPQTFTMASSFDQEGMYFKAGDYDQSVGSSATVGAKVQFYALALFHGP